jgi:lipid A 3-O-deacylase
MSARTLCGLILAAAATAAVAQPELGLAVGRATDSRETDIVRLWYRRPLQADAAVRPWWRPEVLQLGAGAWRVPDVGGRTPRYDVSVTPVWRSETMLGATRGFLEAGLGVHLLSHTIRNDTHRLPSSLQFGSHLGAGIRLGARGDTSIGLAIQHLSNAGLKEPNGGINFVLLTAMLAL